ncbi:hypothetical protein LEP1GSC058_2814 [Leptospira fainei serovar Hurstbridge str. BUT 6]|uniref:Uncharacterized protein n=1 Tax=Leptospira fainei serovar Hurstbridge str. BUT 6 TaxID=1193011 RepID=S3UXN2_9LEPT|nr:hypothetical protein LEP1GSC058_2814 [Leptospira fainei serovar Hurstbridge str. BUT 6]
MGLLNSPLSSGKIKRLSRMTSPSKQLGREWKEKLIHDE